MAFRRKTNILYNNEGKTDLIFVEDKLETMSSVYLKHNCLQFKVKNK